MRVALVVLAVVAGACAHAPPRTTFASDDLYAQVARYTDDDRVTIANTSSGRPVVVRLDQVLETPDHQQYTVRAMVEHCRGGAGDAGESEECLLAQLRGLRFTVHDEAKLPPPPGAPPADAKDTSSWRFKAVLTSVALIAPLTYGVATCHFEGCKVIFGLPAALLALFDLILFTGMG